MPYPQAFLMANSFTQKWEKGYVNHPNDPGGATYNGVSLRFLKQTGIDINGDGHIDAQDILDLYRRKDQATVDAIFHKAFWRDPNLDQFESLPVQIVLYDSSVNTGRRQSAKFLQRAINAIYPAAALAVDSKIGPKTLQAVRILCQARRDYSLALACLDKRLAFHNSLIANSPYPDGRDYRPFAKGWRNRVNDLRKYLAEMGI